MDESVQKYIHITSKLAYNYIAHVMEDAVVMDVIIHL